jgi:hypothetical protein
MLTSKEILREQSAGAICGSKFLPILHVNVQTGAEIGQNDDDIQT